MSAAIERAGYWVAAAAMIALLVTGIDRMEADPRAPRRAPSQPTLQPVRTAAEGDEAGPYRITSLLAVPGRMAYGQSVWDDRGAGDGPVWIRVDRRAQLLSVFRGGHEVGTAVILYGAPEKPTPAGLYPVLAKMRDHRSATYDADMPYTLRLTADGISIHGASVLEGRATHGCIGVPEGFARRLFDAVGIGDPVVIV